MIVFSKDRFYQLPGQVAIVLVFHMLGLSRVPCPSLNQDCEQKYVNQS